ncbi:MAG: hypothetical protein RSD99_19405, partial [Janthinobacterium sp.]
CKKQFFGRQAQGCAKNAASDVQSSLGGLSLLPFFNAPLCSAMLQNENSSRCARQQMLPLAASARN